MMNLFLVVTSNQYQKTKREQNLHLNNYLDYSNKNTSWEDFLMFIIHLCQRTLNKMIKLFQTKKVHFLYKLILNLFIIFFHF
jgi:hypothetical protein